MWPRPADLTGPLKLGDPLRTLRRGVPGTLMPAFANLPDTQLQALATWVRARAQVQPTQRPTPPRPLPSIASEALWRGSG
jgi:mono/diheme cytochrome c family protein